MLLLRNRFVTQKREREKRGGRKEKKKQNKTAQLTLKGCVLEQGLAGAGASQNQDSVCEHSDYAT